jgi:transcriptional regulator with XRE-family HTH domain
MSFLERVTALSKSRACYTEPIHAEECITHPLMSSLYDYHRTYARMPWQIAFIYLSLRQQAPSSRGEGEKVSASRPVGVGLRLRCAREMRNLTQEQLAAALNVSVISINRWEHEKAYPRPDLRRRLCEALDLSSDALFGMPAMLDPAEDASNSSYLPGAAAALSQRGNAGGDTPVGFSDGLTADDSPVWQVRSVRQLDLSDPLLKQGRRPVERYFERSIFLPALEALRAARREGRGGLALFGPAMVGKTRLALEALRREAPDHLLVVWPRHASLLATLAVFHRRPVVLLLDDLHELTTQHDSGGRITAAVQRLLVLVESLIVVATSRSGLDEAATHQHYDGLIESLGLSTLQVRPMARADQETVRFFAFAHQLAEREPARRLSLDVFDGTPGSILLGLGRRTTQLRSPRFPSAVKAILKALALLRTASVYDYPESRVRRVAMEVFELPPERWSDALDSADGSAWMRATSVARAACMCPQTPTWTSASSILGLSALQSAHRERCPKSL